MIVSNRFDRTTIVLPLLLAIAGALGAGPQAREPGYADYSRWLDWARLRVGARAGLASSFDRAGGNEDYSHYEHPQGLITDEIVTQSKTITGPGIIYRFWMPHLTATRRFDLRMYFDGEEHPRIDTTSDAVMSGSYSYFSAPLVTTSAGGQVCYEPIPFRQSLRIETLNHGIPLNGWSADWHYYQFSYLTFDRAIDLSSYTGELSGSQNAQRAAVVDMFDNVGQHPAGDSPGATRIEIGSTAIPSNTCVAIAEPSGPGVVRRLTLKMDSASSEELEGLRLVIRYDGLEDPAIDASAAHFWGAGRLRAPYRSLPMGTDSPDGFYSYWPMPFRHSIAIRLCNTTNDPIEIDGAKVEYELQPMDTDMCYLHAYESTNVRADGEIYHPIFSDTGRGHYVGNLLYIDQPSFDFRMLEGDEVIVVDKRDMLNGTGLEDAYNGGYYYNWVGVQDDEPEGPRPQSSTRPLHGVLYVRRVTGVEWARADQYRWQIGDRIPFSKSIDVKIENFFSVVDSEWTSVAFWYKQPAVPGDENGDGDVDLQDFGAFQRCVGDASTACTDDFDLDANGAVDMLDFALFHAAVTGPW